MDKCLFCHLEESLYHAVLNNKEEVLHSKSLLINVASILVWRLIEATNNDNISCGYAPSGFCCSCLNNIAKKAYLSFSYS